MILLSASLCAQISTPDFTLAQIPSVNDIEYLLTPTSMPCEPGDGDIFSILCPAPEAQGIMVHLRTTDAGAAGFRVTVTYRDRDGQDRESIGVAVRKPSGFSQVVIVTGRVATLELPRGVRIVRLAFEKLYPGPVVIAEAK